METKYFSSLDFNLFVVAHQLKWSQFSLVGVGGSSYDDHFSNDCIDWKNDVRVCVVTNTSNNGNNMYGLVTYAKPDDVEMFEQWIIANPYRHSTIERHETKEGNWFCFDHLDSSAWYESPKGTLLRVVEKAQRELRFARSWKRDPMANKQRFGLILDHYRKMYEPMGGHVFRDTDFEGVDGIFVTYSSGGAYNASRGERQGDRDNTYVLKIVKGNADEMGTCYTPIYGWRANHNVEDEMVDQYPQGIWRAANCDQLRELGC